MFVVHSVHPCEVILKRLANLHARAIRIVQQPKVGLGLGLSFAALAGAPMPLPQLSLLGPLVATCAAGAWGGRAAAAIGFVSFILFGHPGALQAVAAAVIAGAIGWAIPLLVEKSLHTEEPREEQRPAGSAIVIDCDGFTSLDETYGEGTSEHVFRLLHRALKAETRGADLVVNARGHELMLVLEDSSPSVAQVVMERVEQRFGGWLADAGYECNLSVGIANPAEEENEFDELLRAARRDGPYLD